MSVTISVRITAWVALLLFVQANAKSHANDLAVPVPVTIIYPGDIILRRHLTNVCFQRTEKRSQRPFSMSRALSAARHDELFCRVNRSSRSQSRNRLLSGLDRSWPLLLEAAPLSCRHSDRRSNRVPWVRSSEYETPTAAEPFRGKCSRTGRFR